MQPQTTPPLPLQAGRPSRASAAGKPSQVEEAKALTDLLLSTVPVRTPGGRHGQGGGEDDEGEDVDIMTMQAGPPMLGAQAG